MNYYQFHIGDWVLHTNHLTLEEEAVYRRLLDFYYASETAIPEETNRVIRRLRLVGHEETVALILDEFFVLLDDGWHNRRADAEIAEYHQKADKARENGRRSSGRPKKGAANDAAPNESAHGKGRKRGDNPEITGLVSFDNPEITGSKANQEPRTINQEPREGGVRERAHSVPDDGGDAENGSADFGRQADAGSPAPAASPAAAACVAFKSLGIAQVNPSNPKLLALLNAGVTLEMLVAAARDCVGKGKPDFHYVLGTATGQMRDAQQLAAQVLTNPGIVPRGKFAGAHAAIFDGGDDE